VEDGHEEGGYLGVGDELFDGSAIDNGADEGFNFVVAEGAAVALVEDDIDGVDGHNCIYCSYEFVMRKAAGSRSAMVAWATAPSASG